MNKGNIVEAVLQRIDRTWSGRLEPLYKLSTYLLTYTTKPPGASQDIRCSL